MGAPKLGWVKLLLIMFVFLIIILELGWSSEGCSEQERYALLQLKHNFFNDPFSLQDWVEKGDDENYSDCCQWERVKCNTCTGRVIALDLYHTRNRELGEGYLNASLFTRFQQLELLNLSDNNIAGCVENEGLERLSKLSNLKFLDISYNSFDDDSILSSLTDLSSLRNLSVAYNRLEGNISFKEASRKLQSQENKKAPALIAFGDSILDTGNNNNLISIAKCNFPPYGKDFIGGTPTGRFCDGKVLTDLIAEGLGIKETVPAYLDPNLQSKDLLTGVCFASGGSGLDPLTSSITSVIPISGQLKNFKEYTGKLKGVVGEEGANKIISNSLFLLSAGNNDLGITYSILRLIKYDISTYSSMLVSWASTIIKDLYGVGIRKIAVFSTLPVGCVPILRTLHGGLMRSCGDDDNKAAELFNSKLLAEVKNLNSSLPQATIVYVDVYNPLLDLINNPVKSGFSVPDRSCCGTGTIETGLLCNQLIPFTCDNVSEFVFWDSAHPSEKAYRIIASPILQDLKKNFS